MGEVTNKVRIDMSTSLLLHPVKLNLDFIYRYLYYRSIDRIRFRWREYQDYPKSSEFIEHRILSSVRRLRRSGLGHCKAYVRWGQLFRVAGREESIVEPEDFRPMKELIVGRHL